MGLTSGDVRARTSHRLERRLFNKRCGDNEDVRSHFEKLCELRSQLVCLGKSLSDNEFSYILLTSFPTSYDDCIVPLNITAKMMQNDLDPFLVMSAIADFYDLRTLRNSESRATQQRSSSSTTRRKTRKGHRTSLSKEARPWPIRRRSEEEMKIPNLRRDKERNEVCIPACLSYSFHRGGRRFLWLFYVHIASRLNFQKI